MGTALKISERRSRLLGLDAPHTIEARARVDVLSWNQAIRDFITLHKEVFGDGSKDERTATFRASVCKCSSCIFYPSQLVWGIEDTGYR